MSLAIAKSTPTSKELLQQAERYLISKDNARLDSEVLLCHVAGIRREQLYSQPEQTHTKTIVQQFLELVNKRSTGQPVAYLTGKKEFWSTELSINQHTLIPRPETECLVEVALEQFHENKKLDILELGTGSGAIAIAIAKERPACHITATDINHDIISVASSNAKRLGLYNIAFAISDWYSNIDRQFDFIISNPPYIKDGDEHLLHDDIKHEPDIALSGGPDGLRYIRKIIGTAKTYIKHGGWVLIEHGYDQGGEVRSTFRKHNFSNITTRDDYSGHERVSYGLTS